jgi:hypothetical protein
MAATQLLCVCSCSNVSHTSLEEKRWLSQAIQMRNSVSRPPAVQLTSLLLPCVLLQALANREVPIPEHIDMYLLDKEMPASDKIALHVRHRCSSQWHAAPHTSSWHHRTHSNCYIACAAPHIPAEHSSSLQLYLLHVDHAQV